jgi:hypothetical protein
MTLGAVGLEASGAKERLLAPRAAMQRAVFALQIHEALASLEGVTSPDRSVGQLPLEQQGDMDRFAPSAVEYLMPAAGAVGDHDGIW